MSKDAKNQGLRVLRSHLKASANWVAQKLGKLPLFELTAAEKRSLRSKASFPNKQLTALRKWYVWGFQETLIGWSLLILTVLYLVVQSFGQDVGAENLWTEYWGLIFDVLVILVGFGFIQNWKQKREEIARQHELIEDFRRWDNEEARHRILGAIRRLNRRGITSFDFTGGILRDVDLSANGIANIFGAKLSGGNWIDATYKTSIFENVDFSHTDCREVQFERMNSLNGRPFGPSAQYQNCSFWGAKLQQSNFDGAALHWDEPARDDMFETVDHEPDGHPIRAKVVAGRFNEANLAHTSFKGCDFKNADFRDAYCIELADFRGAKGLDSCLFDDDEIKATVIAQSKKPKLSDEA